MSSYIILNFKLSVTTANFLRRDKAGTAFFGSHSDEF